MAKNPEPNPKPQKKMTAKEQPERFIQTARDLEADETGNPFEETFRRTSFSTKE